MRYNGGRVDMLPTSFHDMTVLLAVGASTWQRVLDAAGEHERLKGQPFTHDGLWKSLASDAPAAGSDLLDALEVLHELGTDGGRDLIQQAAEDQQVDLQSSDDEPSRELAARVWIQSHRAPPSPRCYDAHGSMRTRWDILASTANSSARRS